MISAYLRIVRLALLLSALLPDIIGALSGRPMSDIFRSRRWRLLVASAVLTLAAGCADGTKKESAMSAAPGIPPDSTWLAEDIGGRGVIDNAQTTLSIAAEGGVSGSGACNRYSGRATIAGDAISFGPLAATRRACPPALMDQEQRFFDALATTHTYAIDGPFLMLYDQAGQPLVKFTRQT